MAGHTEEIPCWSAVNWQQDCRSGGKFGLTWCGKDDCQRHAAQRHGHWVTVEGGISCLECSKTYRDEGQLNKALAKTLREMGLEDAKAGLLKSRGGRW